MARKAITKNGTSRVSAKIRVLKKEGRNQKQAVAIALSMERHGKLRGHKK